MAHQHGADADPAEPGASLASWLAYIEKLHPRSIEMGLARVREVHGRLGLALDMPVVVVGGTNGKGSTCAFLESILRAAGYRVGLYTSPHLTRYNERIRIDGLPVDDAPLVDAFRRVEAARVAAPTPPGGTTPNSRPQPGAKTYGFFFSLSYATPARASAAYFSTSPSSPPGSTRRFSNGLGALVSRRGPVKTKLGRIKPPSPISLALPLRTTLITNTFSPP
jgi:hypothetical protein